MIGRVAAPAAAKAVASAPVQAIWGAQRGVVYVDGIGSGLNQVVLLEAMKYGVRKEVVAWAKAHPTIVPYINGDKDMIHSIAETGWTRWLVGDGKAWIDSLYKANSSDTGLIEYKFNNINSGKSARLAGVRTGGGGVGAFMYIGTNAGTLQADTTFYASNRGTQIPTTHTIDLLKHVVEVKNNAIYFDGVKEADCDTSTFQHSVNWTLFKAYNNTAYADAVECSIARSVINGIRHFLPCRNPNGTDYGMVDIVSGQFYGNANTQGSFSVELTENT